MADDVWLEPPPPVQIRAGGEPIVAPTRAFSVHEGGLPPRYYVPRDDVNAEVSDGQGGAKCPWKGLWKHVDVSAGGTTVGNAAWTYYETTRACDEVRDFLAFYPDKVTLDVG